MKYVGIRALIRHCRSWCTGTIETPINQQDLADSEKRAYMEKRIPLGRLGKPEDLAGPTVFFLSDMAQYGACTFKLYLRCFWVSDSCLVNGCCSDGSVAIGRRRRFCKFAVIIECIASRSYLTSRQSIFARRRPLSLSLPLTLLGQG